MVTSVPSQFFFSCLLEHITWYPYGKTKDFIQIILKWRDLYSTSKHFHERIFNLHVTNLSYDKENYEYDQSKIIPQKHK